MNLKEKEFEKIYQTELIIYDMEKIIDSCPGDDNYHFVKQKWLIGKRLSQEEVRYQKHDGVASIPLKEVARHLIRRYSSLEYDVMCLKEDYVFYNTHLNLFESNLHQDQRLLEWKQYRQLLDVQDAHCRRELEEKTFIHCWNDKMLTFQIRAVSRTHE